MAGEFGDANAVHRARKPMGERLLRKFQREAAGRMLERRDFLFVAGGADRDRAVAGGVEHQAAALGAGLSAARTGDDRAAICSSPVAYGPLRAAKCTESFVMYTLSHPLVQKLGLINSSPALRFATHQNPFVCRTDKQTGIGGFHRRSFCLR